MFRQENHGSRQISQRAYFFYESWLGRQEQRGFKKTLFGMLWRALLHFSQRR